MNKNIFLVSKSKSIEGVVEISGAKNSALPILCATILIDELVILKNIPPYSDVLTLLKILKSMGKNINYDVANHKIAIDGKAQKNNKLNSELFSKLRASFLVTGSLLAKNKIANVPLPGGCNIGQRPIDLHIKGFNKLGVTTNIENGICNSKCSEIFGTTIYLDFPSVGATENIILASIFCNEKTILQNPAFEPEVLDLIKFLNSAGANIKICSDSIIVTGVKRLYSTTHYVIPDRIEAGTFMIACAITKGDITIKNVIPAHLKSIISKLKEMNVNIVEKEKVGRNERRNKK